MERKGKVFEDLVAILWAEKFNLFIERFAPNHFLQIAFVFGRIMYTVVQRPTTRIVGPGVTSLHVFMMNITRSHRLRRRARRRRPDSETIDITQQHTGGSIATMLAYFNYIQLQTLKDARSIVGLNGLRNTTIVTVPAYSSYFQLLTSMHAESTERYCMQVMMIVVNTYINYLQIQFKGGRKTSTRDTPSG